MINKQAELIAKAFEGPGYAIFLHMDRMNQGYMQLVNADSAQMAQTGLTELRTAAADCETLIRGILYAKGCPDHLIVSVNRFAERNWSLDAMSGLLINFQHYLARFIHTPTAEGKVKELTTLYHLIQDLVACSLEVKSESYRRSAPEDE